MKRTSLTICRTCRPEGADAGDPPGAALGRAVRDAAAARGIGEQVDVRAIACLSACSRACSAAIAAPGKFSYVIGGLGPSDADDLLTFALRHAESTDGVPPWRQRPEKIRKNTVARVPPSDAGHPLFEEIDEDLSLRR